VHRLTVTRVVGVGPVLFDAGASTPDRDGLLWVAARRGGSYGSVG
jgi:hypothetical protein